MLPLFIVPCGGFSEEVTAAGGTRHTVDADHPTRTLTITRTRWGDLCLDAKKVPRVVRAGSAEVLIGWLIGDAPLNITYWDVFFYTVSTMHQPTNKMPAFHLFEGYDRYNNPKKYKNSHNLSGKKNEAELSVCLHIRLKSV